MEISRIEICLVALDSTLGHKIKKTRPYVIISPDEMNRHIGTVIIAPMTSKGRNYPSRVECTFQGVQGQIILDQIRTIDKPRIVKRLANYRRQR